MAWAEDNMLAEINRARTARGVPALTSQPELIAAAREHAADMAAHVGMVHEGSDGSYGGDRMRAHGYDWARWGEIVGWGFGGNVSLMVDWWLNSAAHAPYLLATNVNDIGVGYVYEPNSEWGSYWTVDFGRRDGQAPLPLPYHTYVPVVVAPTNVATAGAIDLLPYFMGATFNGPNMGTLYEVRHPDGQQERAQVQNAAGDIDFYLVKNSQWEQLAADADHIWRGCDTSPGYGRFYVQYETGNRLARWCPRYMRPGQGWTGPGHNVQFYDKATGQPSALSSGRATNRCTFVRHYDSCVWNNVKVNDVIELHANGETFFFARALGMVAWGAAWGRSAVSEIHAPGTRPDNVRETLPPYELT